jgi:hypothetical protein
MSLTIDLKTARKLYDSVPDFFKEQLENSFTKEALSKKKFTDIRTFEDACEALGIDPDAVCVATDTKDEAAYKKIKVVIAAINQGWTPDWNNSNQRKWWPYFVLSSGFGFSRTDCNCDNANSDVGSRLCFETSEKAEYAGKQFTDLYKDFLT